MIYEGIVFNCVDLYVCSHKSNIGRQKDGKTVSQSPERRSNCIYEAMSPANDKLNTLMRPIVVELESDVLVTMKIGP